MEINSPKDAVIHLRAAGLTQREIVAALDKSGIRTTQETVSRIGSGAIKCPGYQLGTALIKLASVPDVA